MSNCVWPILNHIHASKSTAIIQRNTNRECENQLTNLDNIVQFIILIATKFGHQKPVLLCSANHPHIILYFSDIEMRIK